MPALIRPWYRLLLVALLITGGVSCSGENVDSTFGQASPTENVPAPVHAAVEFERDIRPLMERHCLVYHGCYDAPCQLKLDSYQGVLRGASKTRVYESARLVPAAPSRLFEDAQ